MALEAPLSKHCRADYKIAILFCLGVAAVFAYDGYLSKYKWSYRRSFYEKHNNVLLFQVEAQLRTDLDAKRIPEGLRRKFAEAKTPLSGEATVSVDPAGGAWVIADQDKTYRLSKNESGVAVSREGPDDAMWYNQVLPVPFVLLALAVAGRWWFRKDAKIVAGENELILGGAKRIPYDAIEQIDKTHFESKGIFTITYKNENGRLIQYRLTDRHFDNLKPILDHLVAQITA